MAKRYTDTTIWKNQRWFKKLTPLHKLAWKYITDVCDHAGILKIDFGEFVDDLGVEKFDIKEFIKCCNVDFDKENGNKISRERIKLLPNNTVWITGFIKFQYENKEFKVNPAVPAIYSALTIVNSYGTLEEGLNKGYFTLSQPYQKGMLRTKDRDIDMDTDMDSINDNAKSTSGGKFRDFKIVFTDTLKQSCLEIYTRANFGTKGITMENIDNLFIQFCEIQKSSDEWYKDEDKIWVHFKRWLPKQKLNGTNQSVNGKGVNRNRAGAEQLLAKGNEKFNQVTSKGRSTNT